MVSLRWLFQIALVILFPATSSLKLNGQYFNWAKQIGGSLNDEVGIVRIDKSGYVYLLGYFQGVVDFDPGPGILTKTCTTKQGDPFLLKADSAGNTIWVRTIENHGGTFYPLMYAHGFVIDENDDLYLSGMFMGTYDFDPGPGTHTIATGNHQFVFIQKLDKHGNHKWTNAFGAPGSYMGFFTLSNFCNGKIIISGTLKTPYSPIDFDPGPGTTYLSSSDNASFMAVYDSTGALTWAKCCSVFMGAQSIAVDLKKNIYAGGTGLLCKLDSVGNPLWSFPLDECYINAIAADDSTNVYISGYYFKSVDFDPGPSTSLHITNGHADSFIAKYDQDGQFKWCKTYGGPGPDQSVSLLYNRAGDMLATGGFSNTVDFDPGPNHFTLTCSGAWDSFVLQLDTAGHFISAKSLPSIDSMNLSVIHSVVEGKQRELFLAGMFVKGIDLDPGPLQFNAQTRGERDGFILKLGGCTSKLTIDSSLTICSGDCVFLNADGAYSYTWAPGWGTAPTIVVCPTVTTVYSVVGMHDLGCSSTASAIVNVNDCIGVTENLDGSLKKLFPNPSTGTFTVYSTWAGKYQIIDGLGRIIAQDQLCTGKNTVHLKLKPGIYYLLLPDQQTKLIIE